MHVLALNISAVTMLSLPNACTLRGDACSSSCGRDSQVVRLLSYLTRTFFRQQLFMSDSVLHELGMKGAAFECGVCARRSEGPIIMTSMCR